MIARVLRAAMLAVMGVCVFPASASAGTVLSVVSEAGDVIGGGKSAVYVPSTARFEIFTKDAGETVTVSVVSTKGDRWWIDIAAPRGSRLAPGHLYDVERAAFRSGRSGGLDVTANGGACNQVYGDVSVRQVTYDAQGAVTSLEATFNQRCDRNDAPALTGIVRFNAPQRSFRLDSSPGDFVGGGLAKTYYNDRSLFFLSGSRSEVSFAVWGLRDSWRALIQPPAGRSLRPGYYRISRFGTAATAGFTFSGNGRACSSTTGSLRIFVITFDASGNVDKLSADFEQRCDNAQTPLKGSIRYGV